MRDHRHHLEAHSSPLSLQKDAPAACSRRCQIDIPPSSTHDSVGTMAESEKADPQVPPSSACIAAARLSNLRTHESILKQQSLDSLCLWLCLCHFALMHVTGGSATRRDCIIDNCGHPQSFLGRWVRDRSHLGNSEAVSCRGALEGGQLRAHRAPLGSRDRSRRSSCLAAFVVLL